MLPYSPSCRRWALLSLFEVKGFGVRMFYTNGTDVLCSAEDDWEAIVSGDVNRFTLIGTCISVHSLTQESVRKDCSDWNRIMKHGQYPPHPILGDYVKCLWTSERDFRPPNDTLLVLPDIYVELVFTFGSHIQVDDGHSRRDLPHGYIIGLLDRPLILRGHGLAKTVAARFFAWGFSPVFNFNPNPLPNVVHQLDVKWRHLTDQLEQAVLKDDDEGAIDLLHDFLIERALNVRFEQKEIQAASQYLLREIGQVKISELADYCNYSSRQLERKFKQSVGVSPKALARKLRFERVRERLARDPHADLAALAQELGFTDQAHLTNDFKRFGNRTPTQFADEMIALRQEMGATYNVVFLQD